MNTINTTTATGGTPATPTPGRGGHWYTLVKPARVVSAADLREHRNIDTAEISGVSDALLLRFIDAATEYAETRLAASIMPRTIVATFNAGELIELPRGPVIAIVSIVDSDADPITNYSLKTVGGLTQVFVAAWLAGTVTITYTAGYATPDGATATPPADLVLAILMHAGTLYENRETITDKAMTPIPHTLDAFYARKSRQTGVG